MQFEKYTVIENIQETTDTFLLRVIPSLPKAIPDFLPGQFCQIKNPLFEFDKTHIFSIASSPTTKTHLEFCIKKYGPWTQALSLLKKDDTLEMTQPLGKFVWDQPNANAVFFAGGVGITPILSMLRFINDTQQKGKFLLLYGNRTENDIAYKKELESLIKTIDTLRVIHILSELSPLDPWTGEKGFITHDILQRAIDFDTKPSFFLCGPPIFTQKMATLLQEFSVPQEQIKQELFSK